jgi:hypothetical protein
MLEAFSRAWSGSSEALRREDWRRRMTLNHFYVATAVDSD